VAYATVDQLAAALRVTVTAKNSEGLTLSLDAAAEEIDHHCARPTDDPIPADDPLAIMVNVARGLEWYKANDSAFGTVGFADVGVLHAPSDPFARHARTLIPLKAAWGIG
jgi:hypothetical protein